MTTTGSIRCRRCGANVPVCVAPEHHPRFGMTLKFTAECQHCFAFEMIRVHECETTGGVAVVGASS